MSAYEGFQLVVVLLMLTVFALTRAADRYPHVAWLRTFREIFPRLPKEQRRKAQRRANVSIGAQLILLGLPCRSAIWCWK